MQLSEMQTALKRYGFDDSDPLLTWINAAIHDFETAYDWPFFETSTSIALSAGVNTVSLPSDFLKAKLAKISGEGQNLDYLSQDDFDNLVSDSTVRGTPTYFMLVGLNVMSLWPTPDVTYSLTLRYRKKVTELVNASDVPNPFPSSMHFGIVQQAAGIGLQAENEEDRATTELASAQAVIDRHVALFDTKQDKPRTVQDTQGYGSSVSAVRNRRYFP